MRILGQDFGMGEDWGFFGQDCRIGRIYRMGEEEEEEEDYFWGGDLRVWVRKVSRVGRRSWEEGPCQG